MLSEKAKGKQRANDLGGSDDELSTSQLVHMQRELTIRFTEGMQDLVVYVGEKDSVKDLKAKIRAQRSEVQNRRLRLIHSGRLLTDSTLLYPLLRSLEERQQIIQEREESSATTPLLKEPETVWLHCSVGLALDMGETDDGETQQTAQIRALRGLDRLQDAGFTEEEIAGIRRQFHSRESYQQTADPDMSIEELTVEEHTRNLEEQWIDAIDNMGAAALTRSSVTHSSTILQGLLLGFFFPIIPFFLFREPHAPVFWEDGRQTERLPSVAFGQRMQMSIIVGFVLNMLFGLWRYLLST